MELTECTVGQLAAELPASIRVFETWKIDYCCGGRTTLPAACAAAGKSVDEFIVELERVAAVPDASSRDWSGDTLASMASNIVAMYHTYTREELQTILPIADKVLRVHGERQPELAEVVTLVRELATDLLPHMLKEEQVLFPYVGQLENAAAANAPAPTPFFGTVKNPVRMMMLEHERVGELLATLRVVTSGYTPPESACFSYRSSTAVSRSSSCEPTSTSTSRTTSTSRAPSRSKKRPGTRRRSHSWAVRAHRRAAAERECASTARGFRLTLRDQ
jgi:regulator of cell morphogenesis and NO signaling